MAISTLEGVVREGRILLTHDVTLPENTRVYVIVAEFGTSPRVHVASPRLAHPEQAADFAKHVLPVGD